MAQKGISRRDHVESGYVGNDQHLTSGIDAPTHARAKANDFSLASSR
jgi:hypothetical protein